MFLILKWAACSHDLLSSDRDSPPFSVQLYQGHPVLHNKERVQEDSGGRAVLSGSLCCNSSHLAQRWMEGRETGEAIPSPGKYGVIRIRGGGEGIGGLGTSQLLCAFPCLFHRCGPASEPLNLSAVQFPHLPSKDLTI